MSAFGDDVKKLREVAAQQDEMHKAVRDRDEAIGGEGTGGGGGGLCIRYNTYSRTSSVKAVFVTSAVRTASLHHLLPVCAEEWWLPWPSQRSRPRT